jgi:hypothetical protein
MDAFLEIPYRVGKGERRAKTDFSGPSVEEAAECHATRHDFQGSDV